MENQIEQEVSKKKKFLKRYRKNISCVARLEDKLTTLNERIKSVRSPSLSGMPRGGTPVTVDDLIADKIDLEKRIKRLKSKSRKLKEEIVDEIDTLDDPRYCEVLEAYFIDCLTIEEIADKEGYTERHMYRLYNEAVTELAVVGQ